MILKFNYIIWIFKSFHPHWQFWNFLTFWQSQEQNINLEILKNNLESRNLTVNKCSTTIDIGLVSTFIDNMIYLIFYNYELFTFTTANDI